MLCSAVRFLRSAVANIHSAVANVRSAVRNINRTRCKDTLKQGIMQTSIRLYLYIYNGSARVREMGVSHWIRLASCLDSGKRHDDTSLPWYRNSFRHILRITESHGQVRRPERVNQCTCPSDPKSESPIYNTCHGIRRCYSTAIFTLSLPILATTTVPCLAENET